MPRTTIFCFAVYYGIVFLCVNSLWPNDAIWRQRSGSTLAQVMACCLTAPSHYLNQCWLIIRRLQWYSSEDNFRSDISATNHWNKLENYSYKILLKYPRGQWVRCKINMLCLENMLVTVYHENFIWETCLYLLSLLTILTFSQATEKSIIFTACLRRILMLSAYHNEGKLFLIWKINADYFMTAFLFSFIFSHIKLWVFCSNSHLVQNMSHIIDMKCINWWKYWHVDWF